jgi:hypothetical protein
MALAVLASKERRSFMLIGAHAVIYSTNPEADRAFLRDVIKLTNVDAGGGYVIFGLPPSEVAVHQHDKNDSVLAMFLFNGGIIALINPVPMSGQILRFYLPYALATVILICLIMMTRNVSRWAGIFLVLVYFGFVAGSYLIE